MKDTDLEELRANALKQLERIERGLKDERAAQAELQLANLELAKIRLQAGGSARALHRALDHVMSW